MASVTASLKQHLAAFVHPSIASDPLRLAHHALFIGTRTSMALLALATAPLFLAFHGAPSLWQSMAFFWMVLPLAGVAMLSRTGRLVPSQIICVLSLLGLSLTFAIGGGLGVALSWLLLVPVEAAMTLNATAIVVASAATVFTACGLYMAQIMGFLPGTSAMVSPLELIGLLLPGIIYGASLAQMALTTHKLHREAELVGAARLQSLSSMIGDLVLRHDRQGNVQFVGSGSEELFALTSRDLHGRGFFEHVHVADRPAFLKTIADAARQDLTTIANLRLRCGYAAKAERGHTEPVFAWIELRARRIALEPLASGHSNDATVLAIVRDITLSMRHGEDMAAAREKAEQASVWKDRFLANVSHELRTPLNAIIGFSEMLGSEELSPRDPAKQREYADIIHSSGQHLLSVVNTILDMSKIEAGSFELMPEPFEVAPLVSQCCDIVSLRAQHGGVEIVRDCPIDLEELTADKRACKQILINLLSNAVKFTRSGGRVTVGVRPDGNSLRLFVSDTGIGIPARDLPRLGDPFFQATSSHDRPYEGTGLGLSVVRGLVGLHGGEICIESAVSVGTCVSIRLPLDCRSIRPTSHVPAKIETISRSFSTNAAPSIFNSMGMKKSA